MAGAGAATAPGAPSFLVNLLELESRLAVRLDNEEVRLTNRVAASRNTTLSAFETRLSKIRKADATVDKLFRSATGDLNSLIINVRTKSNIAKPAAKKAQARGSWRKRGGGCEAHEFYDGRGKWRGLETSKKDSGLPPPPANMWQSGSSSLSSSSSISSSNTGEPARAVDGAVFDGEFQRAYPAIVIP